MTKLRHLLAISLLAGAACFFLSTGTTSAATIDVVAGTNVLANDSECHLTEAIANINNAANTYVDCIATGDAYGTNDTINLPTGTITLTADLPPITRSVTVTGQGMGETIVNGDGQWQAFSNNPSNPATLSVQQLTVTAYRNFALFSVQGSVVLGQFEVDGTGVVFDPGPSSAGGGIAIANNSATPISVNVSDVYIHDLAGTVDNFFVMAILASDNEDTTATVDRVTISNVSNTGTLSGIMIGTGVLGSGAGPGQATGTLRNITISGLSSQASAALGVVSTTVAEVSHTTQLTLQNATITGVTGATGMFGQSSAVAAVAGNPTDGPVNESYLIMQNVLLADSDTACSVVDLTPIIGGVGAATVDITSTGGNLSDDNTCSSYFTHPTDQNNVAALAASLSPLADNGGYVPTMALLETSPAVDAGVTVSGLTTDARGQARPQGNAYDSGAYESPFTRTTTPAPPTDDGEGLAESGAMIAGILAIAVVMVGGAVVTFKKPRKQSAKSRKK
jgi:hypothetical protein